jgi:hypothetical protein
MKDGAEFANCDLRNCVLDIRHCAANEERRSARGGERGDGVYSGESVLHDLRQGDRVRQWLHQPGEDVS